MKDYELIIERRQPTCGGQSPVKCEIRNVSTDDPAAYVRKMETEDLDIMSEFMVMAAELISIKCRMLLPVENKDEEDEGDPREELVRRLLEYKTYKYMSYELRDRMEDASMLFYKEEDTTPDEVRRFRPEVHAEEVIGDLTLEKLHEIFRQILRRQSEKIDPIRSRFGTIEKEEVSLPDKLESVAKYAKKKKNFSFRELLEKQHSKTQVVVTFLAVLELMSYGFITAEQKGKDDDILIRQCSDMNLDQVRERFNMSDIEDQGDSEG